MFVYDYVFIYCIYIYIEREREKVLHVAARVPEWQRARDVRHSALEE